MRSFILHYKYLSLLLCILVGLPNASPAPTDHYDDCIPFQLPCKAQPQNITFGYPFRAAHRPDYCGFPGFDVFCSDDGYPTIRAGSRHATVSYRINALDLANRTLSLVNADFLDSNSCPDPALATTWDVSPFNYTDSVQKIALVYNCSSPINDIGFTVLPCPAAVVGEYAYYATESIIRYPYQGCSESSNFIYAALGLDQEGMDRLMRGGSNASGLVAALQLGFQVTWNAGDWWCSTCIESGGRCGYNASDPQALVCFCQGYTSYSLECPRVSDQYSSCSPSQLSCGHQSIDVGYPFRTASRPEYCGVPGFEVSCSANGYPVIQVGSNNPDHQIKQLDLVARTLTAVSTAFVGESCPDSLVRTNGNMTPYYYTDQDQKLTLFYGCDTEANNVNETGFTKLSCSSNSFNSVSYYATTSATQPSARAGCIGALRIALLRATADRLMNEATTSSAQFKEALLEGFELSWSAGDGWCNTCILSEGRCGYDGSQPGEPLCFCPGNKASPTKCTERADVEKYGTGGTTKKEKIIIGITVAIGSLLIALILLLGFYFCGFHPINLCKSIIFKNKKGNAQHVEAFLENYGLLGPKRYTYSEIKKMTKSFSDKLGEGGYGSVFKGKLVDGRIVAVKVLTDSKDNGEEFINEVASIGRTHHVNIVSLLGFCSDGSKRALIYEFMPNGSLEKFIYSEDGGKVTKTLGWEKLYDIATGIARGLEYLHRGCHMRILHFDIKPHNILLDEDFCPKISDFGLAKLCPGKVSILSTLGARGTAGYIAPEFFCRNFGAVSSKSDVYSYGMMILEMVGGRKNIDIRVENDSAIYFPHWVYKHLSLDGDLKECGASTQVEEEIARKMILVGLWCIQTDPASRPSISRAVEMLQGRVGELKIPPKPYLSSPSRSYDQEPSLTTVS